MAQKISNKSKTEIIKRRPKKRDMLTSDCDGRSIKIPARNKLKIIKSSSAMIISLININSALLGQAYAD